MKCRLTISRFWRDLSGAAAIEFAMVVIPFLLLLLGAFELGRFVWTRHVIQEAAISGARYIGVTEESLDNLEAKEYIQLQAISRRVSLLTEKILIEIDSGCAPGLTSTRVQVDHKFITLFPMVEEIPIDIEACFPNQPNNP